MTDPAFAPRSARHFDDRSHLPREATVRLEPGALIVERGEGLPARWPLERVKVVSADRSGVQLEMSGERIEALIVPDPSFLDALRVANGGRGMGRIARGGPPVMRLLFAAGLACLLALFAAWRWGIPALAGVAAGQVPPEWERRFGLAVVEGMAPARDRVRDERVVAGVDGIFRRLVAAQASPRDSFRLIVVRSKTVNAFAAPGGWVVVTTGLLGALRGPEELASVLAHEISHVARRHTTRGLFARLGVRALFALLAGDAGGIGIALDAAGRLGELSYSRGDESDADAGAVELMARAGLDPAALDGALESIAGAAGGAKGPELTFLSTHPSTTGRRERVRALAAARPVAGAPVLLDAASWRAMRRALEGDEGRPQAIPGTP